ncbi:MAG TPA: polysaccharide biosynthesis tyrosine autokinase [Gemmatimonadaceae bacterium]|nr:polysaccharide biosynthesis tyrosine autokinase [Gemmatimonadaceae bacterium]
MTQPVIPSAVTQFNEADSDDISLAEIVGILMDSRWLVTSVSGGILLLAILYALFAAPVYKPSALVQVNQNSGGLRGLETLSSMLEGTSLPVDAEIQLAKSNSVLMTAAQAVHADIPIEPDYFPLFGGLISRRFRGIGPAPERLGLSGYSWGNDHVEVARFDVPYRLYDKTFRLQVVTADSFQLSDPSGQVVVGGRKGVLAQSRDSSVGIVVSRIEARAGVSFSIKRQDLQETVKNITSRLTVDEQGTQSGILKLTLSGPDADFETRLLAAIVSADVELNRNLRAEQAASQIAFLQDQLPIMQDRVDTARRQLGDYQAAHKVLDLSEESQALLDRLSNLDQAITTVTLQRAQIQQQFGGASPALRAVDAQQDTLRRQRAALEQQVAKLPGAAQSVLQLQENLQVASDLYSGLLTSIQQLQVVKAGAVGDLSIVDLPMEPHKTDGPPRALIVLSGLVVGLMLGSGLAFVRRAFLQRVEDPSSLESRFGLPTLAILPYSSEQTQRERDLQSTHQGREPLLAVEAPQDAVVEELRSLRTSLQFLMPTVERPVLCVSGLVSGVGKSFISANLACLAADAGMRVLVVDSDMRRGHLHRYFGLSQDPGLSALLSGVATQNDVIRPGGKDGLFVVTAGVYPPNPAELLLRPAFTGLLDQAAKDFDLVIVDAPPVLPVTDGVIVAQRSAMTIIAVKASTHTIRELQTAVSRYRQNGIRPNGFVMNYLRPRSGGYGYYYGYKYKYTYRTSTAD